MERFQKIRMTFLVAAVLGVTACGSQSGDPEESSTNESSQSSSSEAEESSVSESSTQEPTESIYTTKDFFPNTDNLHYEYTGEGIEYAGFSESTVYSTENRKQFSRNNGGTEVAEVIALQEDQLVVLYHKGEVYYRENALEKSNEPIEILLQSPFQVGASWEIPDGHTKTITGLEVPVTTELAEYETLEVTTEWDNESAVVVDYYAPEIGLVKSVFTDDEGNEVITEIQSITETPFEQTIRFYYPNFESEQVEYVNKTVQMNTNDSTKDAIESAYKEIPEGLTPVLSENVDINTLYLNDDGRVYVDFSQELMDEMNAGSLVEQLIVESLVNTIGNYYDVTEVYLTVAGKPYQTGHIEQQEGDFFQVDVEGIPEFQLTE